MLRTPLRVLALSTGAAVLLGASPAGDGIDRALAAVSAPRIAARIQFLADDLLEGRGTGARGSEIAARYIAAQYAEDGLEPAGDAGTYLQNFEMVGVSAAPSSALAFETPKGRIELKNGENSVLSSRDQRPDVAIDAPVVFVG